MNPPTNVTDLISPDAIPVNAGWSSIQEALVKRLSGVLGDLIVEPESFLKRAISVLVMNSDCRGLAYSVHMIDTDRYADSDTVSTVLCRYLRAEILYTATQRPELAGQASLGIMAVEKIDQYLGQLRGVDEWSNLFARPHRKRNRLIHYQLEITSSPAYGLVAAPLHHGACSKISQLLSQPDELFDNRLAGFLNWTIQIALAIRKRDVRESLADYGTGEFDQVIRQTIRHIQVQRSQTGNSYRPSSLDTLCSDWKALFYGTARDNKYRDRSTYADRLARQMLNTAESERMSSADDEIKKFMEAELDLEQLERNELEPGHTAQTRKDNSQSIAYSLDDGHACLLANPTTCMPGVLPRVILAMIYEGLDRLPDDWPELNRDCARLLILCMLHLGRRPEWLLKLQLSPGTIDTKENLPVYNPTKNSIYFLPDQYLGLPSLLAPGQEENDEVQSLAWLQHDLIFETINLIHEFVLPSPLINITQTYLDLRKQAIDEQPLMAAGLKVRVQNGLFFLWMRDGTLSTVTEVDVSNILAHLTDIVRWYVPDYPNLKPANFTRSFDAYYAGNGMRGEYRYGISGRGRYWLQMPLRYSRYGSDQVKAVHESVCKSIERQIHDERTRLKLHYSDNIT